MLFPAIDMERRQVTDIMLGGDAAHLYKELIDLYNMMTGEKRTTFNSLDEAKRMCIEAVQLRYFGGEVKRPIPTPPPAPPQNVAPVPPARQPPWLRPLEAKPTYPAPKPTIQVPAVASTPAPVEKEHAAEGPVARARKVFDEMAGAPRKDVIDACAKLGIKRSTAQTQYQAWKKAREEAQEHRNPNTGMPQLAPGSYVGSAPVQH